jgi:hypothetical protein
MRLAVGIEIDHAALAFQAKVALPPLRIASLTSAPSPGLSVTDVSSDLAALATAVTTSQVGMGAVTRPKGLGDQPVDLSPVTGWCILPLFWI